MRFSHHSHQQAVAHRRRAQARQKGYVLVMFALLLIPMLLMAGFSVDVGLWYNRVADMRKAADAAALAGVVWLPDETAARNAALDAAARNGFTNGGSVTVTAIASPHFDRQIQVTITDTQVGSFFYQNLGGRKIPISRTSYAEYVLPVPMGSPRNFFGTGRLLGASPAPVPGFTSEELFQSVNTYCSDKVNGDRHQPMSKVGSRCSGNQAERKPYQLYIEAKEGRPDTIDVMLLDPRFSTADVTNPYDATTTCTYNWPSWPSGSLYSGSGGVTITGPAQYRIWNGSNWGSTQTVDSGDTDYINPNRYYRVRYPTGPPNCTTTYGVEQEFDRYYNGSGNESYTFTLFSADNTPLNDSDNPVKCTRTFTGTTPFDSMIYLGSVRWNKLCSITPAEPSGRYILRVQNSGSSSPFVDGENNWGLVAKYTGQNPGLCDGRTDGMCPRVYGKQAISVRAVAGTTQAKFFLAEIGPEHAGKVLRLELWDPGEGGNYIRFLRPDGSAASVTWKSYTESGTLDRQGSGTSISVTGSIFNGRRLVVDISLAGYSPPANNNWWQVEYNFSGIVTDRTVWSAEVLGDPIHLVENL